MLPVCAELPRIQLRAWCKALPPMCACLLRPQNGAYLKDRGAVQERLGHTFDATLDYSAALPLLREAGLPTADATFNRGYCQRCARGSRAC